MKLLCVSLQENASGQHFYVVLFFGVLQDEIWDSFATFALAQSGGTEEAEYTWYLNERI